MEPTHVYRCPGKRRSQSGILYDYKGVSTEEQLKESLASGWSETLHEAMEASLPKEDREPKAEEPKGRLSAKKKAEILELLKDETVSMQDVADEYNVSVERIEKLKDDGLH